MFYFSNLISYTLGLNSKLFLMKEYCFGTGVFSNVTQLKLPVEAFIPRFQIGNTNFLMVLNTPFEAPGVENGRIVAQKITFANFTIDQRFANNLDLGRLQRDFLSVWEEPEKYM